MTTFIHVSNVYFSTYSTAYYTTLSNTPSTKAPYPPNQSPAEAVYANSLPIVLATIC